MEVKKRLKSGLALMLLSIGIVSCDETLSTVSPNETPAYFIECYMRPNELYNLTATQIQPIFEDYILDYSFDFDVFIIDTDTAELRQSLFVEPGTNFIYNYGSPERLDINFEEVHLFVLSPNGDTITAKTTIPEQVEIESAELAGNEISANFYTTVRPNQNFYIVIVNFFIENEEEVLERKFDIQYLELGDTSETVLQNVKFENELYEQALGIKLTLMRVTEENFNYQKSLEDAKSAGSDNITFPSPLSGNIVNGIGIFTAYTEDVMEL